MLKRVCALLKMLGYIEAEEVKREISGTQNTATCLSGNLYF